MIKKVCDYIDAYQPDSIEVLAIIIVAAILVFWVRGGRYGR